MQDLMKIEKPFFLLDVETQARLRAHKGPIEFVTYKGWECVHNPQWNVHLTYRAATASLTKPSINWDHVAPKWAAMATDECGTTWLYSLRPNRPVYGWASDGSDLGFPESFASFVPGTCDWRDSLVMRPGCEA